MSHYSERSKGKLKTADPRLQVVFNEVIKHFDCTIIEGRRDKAAQDKAYREGNSKVQWPDSAHNVKKEDDLASAVDAAPYSKKKPHINWTDRERFHFFAGFVKGIATSLGINIRWGGDWDQDTEVKDNTFDDLVHFELVGE